jgi:hypothetical protein
MMPNFDWLGGFSAAASGRGGKSDISTVRKVTMDRPAKVDSSTNFQSDCKLGGDANAIDKNINVTATPP